ncbi:MAG: DUF192 domain-containing protein [Alphaproteobacteria bacterium]|nr:DUF192 domain-containing protein [Alphaproteobacteria bacterium]
MLFLIAAAIVLVAGFYFSSVAQKGARLETLVIEGKLGGRHSFEVEIASTPAEEEIGLMFREQMAPDHGMLFEMGRTAKTSFWMKNTLIPLDMLFIAADGEIKTIHENAVPKSLEPLSSGVPVAAVLEINGGRARELGIRAGDRVIHPYFKGSQP